MARFRPIGDVELSVDVREVELDRLLGHPELRGRSGRWRRRSRRAAGSRARAASGFRGSRRSATGRRLVNACRIVPAQISRTSRPSVIGCTVLAIAASAPARTASPSHGASGSAESAMIFAGRSRAAHLGDAGDRVGRPGHLVDDHDVGAGFGDRGAAGAAAVDVAGDAHAGGAAEAAADRLGREAVVGDDDDEHQAASPSGGPPSQKRPVDAARLAREAREHDDVVGQRPVVPSRGPGSSARGAVLRDARAAASVNGITVALCSAIVVISLTPPVGLGCGRRAGRRPLPAGPAPSVSGPAVAGTTALAPARRASASQPASGRAARTTTRACGQDLADLVEALEREPRPVHLVEQHEVRRAALEARADAARGRGSGGRCPRRGAPRGCASWPRARGRCRRSGRRRS